MSSILKWMALARKTEDDAQVNANEKKNEKRFLFRI